MHDGMSSWKRVESHTTFPDHVSGAVITVRRIFGFLRAMDHLCLSPPCQWRWRTLAVGVSVAWSVASNHDVKVAENALHGFLAEDFPWSYLMIVGYVFGVKQQPRAGIYSMVFNVLSAENARFISNVFMVKRQQKLIIGGPCLGSDKMSAYLLATVYRSSHRPSFWMLLVYQNHHDWLVKRG